MGALLYCGIATAQVPQTQVKEITDTRTTGSFFKGLKVELAFVGDGIHDARGLRALRVNKATDNTGRSLVKNEEKSPLHPYHYAALGSGFSKTELSLHNPSRSASALQELSGEALFHVPDRDPASVIVVKSLPAQFGKPIPALEKKGVRLVVLDRAASEQLKARNQQRQPGASLPPAKNGGEKMADELVGLFSRLGQAFSTLSEGDIQFLLDDPQSVVVDLELRDGTGKKIATPSRMFFNSAQYTVSPAHALPPDAQLAIYTATPKSIVSVPFRLSGIALP